MIDDPVPPAARRELERLARRWQQLPLDRALRCVPAVHALAQRFADQAVAPSLTGDRLPDLGPAVVIDQLIVTTHDLAAARAATPTAEPTVDIAAELAALRRDIG
ncbi:hypothetical protein BJY21_003405 [Kineosphaera limosa]|uniref:Uncharacterized protein n=1 Tax=Kineosphaera limosa NBRC 100340 TaxID=1184609 RepID=K6WJV6_9MICO|nr:hypothetical protein [Kineosphaera limosa]NYE02221.1 hypothetical protein [Kineosphaera limosa]GAB94076.1 hypothetical protein KILIM_002_00330 [Kineosphaera limosa NBRC 100340]